MPVVASQQAWPSLQMRVCTMYRAFHHIVMFGDFFIAFYYCHAVHDTRGFGGIETWLAPPSTRCRQMMSRRRPRSKVNRDRRAGLLNRQCEMCTKANSFAQLYNVDIVVAIRRPDGQLSGYQSGGCIQWRVLGSTASEDESMGNAGEDDPVDCSFLL